ncbi:MAG: integrin alpha [Kofleriaceae bacterium]
MRGTERCSRILAVSAFVVGSVLVSGCGDPPLCQSEVFVALQLSQIGSDVDAVTEGVQADIRVRTSLTMGTEVTLEALDAAGTIISTSTAAVDNQGNAMFTAVTVPSPSTTLRASAHTVCGDGSDEITVDVVAGAGCELALTPVPEDNEFYQPLRVLSTQTDPDPINPGYQLTALVTALPGWEVTLRATSGGTDRVLETKLAGSNGVAAFAQTFGDGEVALRASCTGAGSTKTSLTQTVLVDTTPPDCAFTAPAPGTTITPTFDSNGDLADGVQLAVQAHIDGVDVTGEAVALTITPEGGTTTAVTASAVDATGNTIAAAALAPEATPAIFVFELNTQDHAGNACTSVQPYQVIYDGCEIAITSPIGAVTSDADANPTNGSQVDVGVHVSSACVGRTVTSTCGSNSPSETVPASGALTLRVDACATSPCEAMVPCTVRVTTESGVETQASTTIEFDDQGPGVSLQLIAPPLACGAQVTPAMDANPGLDGVQLIARVSSADAATRSLQLTNSNGTAILNAASDVQVTLAPGTNTLVGLGADANGNQGQSAACAVTLADLNVSFSAPAADGLMSRSEGTVAGSMITFPLCGTVSKPGAAVQVSIDGGAPLPTTVTGTSWCRTVTLAESPPSHTILASATAGASFGSSSLVLRIDLTVPPSPIAFTAVAVNRQRIEMTWQSPSDAGQSVAAYLVKYATTALTDGNFNSAGIPLATAPPRAPGTMEVATLFPARTGTSFWIGIAALDEAGNRAPATIIGPITPGFDRFGAIAAPDVSNGALNLGYAIAHGKFNDDEYEDLAISAPTEGVVPSFHAGAVYVYFGSGVGISATPDLKITSTVSNGRLGLGLATVRWSSATRDDLAIGAPGVDGNGHIFVLRGGASFGTGTRVATTADLHIAANPMMPGWFAGSGLGSTLIAPDVDGDGIQDLVASAPSGGGGNGGIVILYGGTVNANVLLSDIDPASNEAVCELFVDPGTTPSRRLGFYLHDVGPTEGTSDLTDDIAVVYVDDYATIGESLYLLRSDGTRPAAAGITPRFFTAGRDVQLDFATTVKRTEWGAQITSIDDQNSDGHRDLVISSFRGANDIGRILIVSGATMGVGGIASTADPGVTLSTIVGIGGDARFGSFILHDRNSMLDIDGDGREDLMVGGAPGGIGTGFVWFGGAIPLGSASTTSAQMTLVAPAPMGFARAISQGGTSQAVVVGDLDNDGLEDVCWASPFDNAGDGSFEILAD